jgi:hypothetical protein
MTSTTTSTTSMKPIMMSTSAEMEDPFADLPTIPSATDDTLPTAVPQLVSPLEFGTGIKYVVQQQQQQHQGQVAASSSLLSGEDVVPDIQKDTDHTETTVDDDVDTTETLDMDTPSVEQVAEVIAK